MPTEQPSNAPDQVEPNDDLSAARVLSDDALDTTPGGGGLGGASAADPLGGSARGGGGQAPDTPFETATGSGGDPVREAQRRSIETTPSTGGRSSGS